jgi:hypothetical protein
MASSNPPSLPPGMQMSVLVFLKSLATPLVLYSENPTTLYDEIKQIVRSANLQSPKLIEKQGVGPLKKVAFLDTEVSGVAVQLEPALNVR